MGDLALRSATGVVVAGVALWAIWTGGLVLALTGLACLAALHWEWARLTLPGGGATALVAMSAAAIALGALAETFVVPGTFGHANSETIDMAIVGAAAALLYFGLTALPRPMLRRMPRYVVWPLWFGPALISLLWLRQSFGPMAAIWPVAVVIAADVGGYLVGRLLGGAKLWPRLSPSKTWSGFVGSLALGATVGGFAGAQGLAPAGNAGVTSMFVAGFFVALASVLGDLAQSAIKRRAGVKDSGGLLPGHGGVFDRLDGHLFALPAFALMIWWMGWPLDR